MSIWVYVSDVTGNLDQIARTCSQTLMAFDNHYKNEITSARGWFIGIMCSIWTMVNITHSRYRPMQYISVKGDIIVVYAIHLFLRIQWYLVERSDKSCGIYLRAAFMTVFALHPEAIIWGQLPYRPRLLIDILCWWNTAVVYSLLESLLESLLDFVKLQLCYIIYCMVRLHACLLFIMSVFWFTTDWH